MITRESLSKNAATLFAVLHEMAARFERVCPDEDGATTPEDKKLIARARKALLKAESGKP
jgi:hypothetical protein